jgi:hypothetical protein
LPADTGEATLPVPSSVAQQSQDGNASLDELEEAIPDAQAAEAAGERDKLSVKGKPPNAVVVRSGKRGSFPEQRPVGSRTRQESQTPPASGRGKRVLCRKPQGLGSVRHDRAATVAVLKGGPLAIGLHTRQGSTPHFTLQQLMGCAATRAATQPTRGLAQQCLQAQCLGRDSAAYRCHRGGDAAHLRRPARVL